MRPALPRFDPCNDFKRARTAYSRTEPRTQTINGTVALRERRAQISAGDKPRRSVRLGRWSRLPCATPCHRRAAESILLL
jgi:hypothetical protein